jgi:hypothetical protein
LYAVKLKVFPTLCSAAVAVRSKHDRTADFARDAFGMAV